MYIWLRENDGFNIIISYFTYMYVLNLLWYGISISVETARCISFSAFSLSMLMCLMFRLCINLALKVWSSCVASECSGSLVCILFLWKLRKQSFYILRRKGRKTKSSESAISLSRCMYVLSCFSFRSILVCNSWVGLEHLQMTLSYKLPNQSK